MSIINLPNWRVLQVQETEDDYRIRAEYRSVKSVIDWGMPTGFSFY